MRSYEHLPGAAIVRRYLDRAHTSIWLLPTALCIIAVILASLLVELDRCCQQSLPVLPALELDVAAARQLLGVLVTSVLSVGGVSFSVTMVALTLTSGQYGPKVLRHFLADLRSKLSLGLFFATAVYSLTVAISLGAGDRPRFSVIVALALALLALIEFVAFIHRTATDLQADQLIQRIGAALRDDMSALIGAPQAARREQDTLPWRRVARGKTRRSLLAEQSGYVQTVDYAHMARALRQANAVAALRVSPGDFVVQGEELLGVWCADSGDAELLHERLGAGVSTGPIRTPIQDPEFPITQIQQIAARALSTGINDPGTAITCVDWLTLTLSMVVDEQLPGRVVVDEEGDPRVLARGMDFAKLTRLVYAPLRQFTSTDLQVAARLLESLDRLAAGTQRRDRLDLLHAEGERVWEQIRDESHADEDLQQVRTSLQRLRRHTA